MRLCNCVYVFCRWGNGDSCIGGLCILNDERQNMDFDLKLCSLGKLYRG